MKKIILFLAVLGAFAHSKEKVAVYMSGKNQTSEQSEIVAFALTDAINESKIFTATERTRDFLSAIRKENLYHHSGAVDDEQIADIGKKSGARYVCVAVLTSLSEAFNGSKESLLTARLIDVESATIAASVYRVATITGDESMLSFSQNLAKALLRNFEGKDRNAKKEPAAIYLASGDSSGIGKVLQSLLIDAVANSKEYAASERTNVFLEKLSQELRHQYSGEVDDEQLSKLGIQSGVKYVAVLKTVSKIVNIRVIDVVSGDIVKSKSGVVDISDMEKVRKDINKLTEEIFTKDIAFGRISYVGQTYKTVEMPDGKEWFAENLNYDGYRDSKCYRYDVDNCKEYGRLYEWTAAISACPVGWHLPTKEEWENLVNAVGGEKEAKLALKSKNGWIYNGTDKYGFSALPGGRYREYVTKSGLFFTTKTKHHVFGDIIDQGYWWTASKTTDYRASTVSIGVYFYTSDYGQVEKRDDFEEKEWLSVRCVKD